MILPLDLIGILLLAFFASEPDYNIFLSQLLTAAVLPDIYLNAVLKNALRIWASAREGMSYNALP